MCVLCTCIVMCLSVHVWQPNHVGNCVFLRVFSIKLKWKRERQESTLAFRWRVMRIDHNYSRILSVHNLQPKNSDCVCVPFICLPNSESHLKTFALTNVTCRPRAATFTYTMTHRTTYTKPKCLKSWSVLETRKAFSSDSFYSLLAMHTCIIIQSFSFVCIVLLPPTHMTHQTVKLMDHHHYYSDFLLL